MCATRTLGSSCRAGLVLVLALGLAAAAARADTYSVCPGGGADFDNIQACVDWAATGDVCELCDATFTGPGNYNIDYDGKGLTVRSASGNPQDCVINVAGQGTGFWFFHDEDYNSKLEGVKITGGVGVNDLDGNKGGAIRCGKNDFFDGQTSGSPDILNCILEGNTALQGGGLACTHGSDPTLGQVQVIDNTASGFMGDKLGGGLYAHNSAPYLWDCDFIGNVVGGGLVGSGGAMFLQGAPAYVEFCRFTDNVAIQGGGIYSYGSRPDINNDTFSGNQGGAIFLYGNTPFAVDITWCTMYGNSSFSGAGIKLSNGATANVSNTIISMSTEGEAVACYSAASPSLTCCDVYGNAGGDWVGCIAGQDTDPGRHNLSAYPGFCDPQNEDFTVRDLSPCIPPAPPDPQCGSMIGVWPDPGCFGPQTYSVCPDGSEEFSTIQAALDAALDGDTIELCPGLYAGDGNRDLDYGGKSLTVRCQTGAYQDCIINCGGSPTQPHRGFVFESGEGPGAVLEAVTINNGYAPWPGGGGIYIDGASPSIENCFVVGNATANEGGGIYCDDGAPQVNDCTLSGNDSGGPGGGMACGWGCSAHITDTVFVDNVADDDGGGLVSFAGVTVRGCTFDHNHAAGHGGGMSSMGTTDPAIDTCVFVDNSAGNPPNWGAGGGLALFHFQFGHVVEHCTFADNSATAQGGGVYVAPDTSYATFNHCTFSGNAAPVGGALNFDSGACGAVNDSIVAFSALGGSVVCDECPVVPMSCCDVFGNTGGDWISCIAGNAGSGGNISLDPLFCDAANDDYTIDSASPCVANSPPNPECGLIGAWPIGCGELTCTDVSNCADRNGDRIRDDNCVWWDCLAGSCVETDIVFADVGGQFGVCPPDGVADSNDRFHVLNCFANEDTLGNPGAYPCEPHAQYPPTSYNIDAGGQFGSCIPDGVADGNDVFHALNAFDGTTTCSCPQGGGPAPEAPAAAPLLSRARLQLEPPQARVRPGGLVEVQAHLHGALPDLRGYQLHLGVSGGRQGALRLVDIAVQERRHHVFGTWPDWQAFNIERRQMLAGLDGPGVAAAPGAYLATFTFQATRDAAGTFAVELLHDDGDPQQRSYLFPTRPDGRIAITSATTTTIEVSKNAKQARANTRAQVQH